MKYFERKAFKSAIFAAAKVNTVLYCVSALSDRKQQWQELELPSCNPIREKFSRVDRSASNTVTSRGSKKTVGNKTKRKMEY